jgi:signal transduction histidine kinase
MPIVTDEADTWVVSAPVLSEGAPEALSDSAGPSQFLGTAVLVVSKAPYRQTIRTIIVINAAAALAATALLIGLLTLQIRRITGPLRALSEAMRRDARLPAEVALVGGSREMRNIASVYNEMVGAVSGAQAALQTQVEIRTEELKAARDQALAAKQQQSEIMAAVTHEMKTPLQGIKGYAELSLEQLVFVQEEESARRIREAQGNILEGAEELRTRIGQVLDLAQAEGGKHEVKIERLLLPTLLHAIADTIRPLAATNGNTLHLEFDDTQFVETDGGKLRQIAINLLTNACKFTEDGEIRFISRSGGETLVLEVADTGIGIDPKNHDLIFERFRQVDMSSTRNYGGTGLGLAVAKEFAKLLGGTISVRSALGTGAAFTVSVPSFLA